MFNQTFKHEHFNDGKKVLIQVDQQTLLLHNISEDKVATYAIEQLPELLAWLNKN